MSENILAMANPLLCGIFAIVFFALWRRDTTATWIVIIAATYASRAAGFFTFHFSENPNGLAVIVIMHLFYSISAITIVWGICARNGQQAQLKTYLLIAAIGLVLIVGSTFGQDYNARLYAANASYGLILALGTQTAIRKVDKDLLDKTILFLLAMGAFQFFVRPILAIVVEGAMTAEQYRETPFYAVMVVWLAVASLLMAMSLLIGALTDQMNSMREESQRDSLTGLKMRGPFEEAAIAMLHRAKDQNVPIGAIVGDIDHFKQVNDIWGHQVGDNAIAAFGDLLGSTIRSTDVAGRIGGEEFCVLVWDCPGDSAAGLAERVRRRFERLQIEGMSSDVRLTASFGVAAWDSQEGYGKLFARADAALYAAKEGGRNRVVHDGRDRDGEGTADIADLAARREDDDVEEQDSGVRGIATA